MKKNINNLWISLTTVIGGLFVIAVTMLIFAFEMPILTKLSFSLVLWTVYEMLVIGYVKQIFDKIKKDANDRWNIFYSEMQDQKDKNIFEKENEIKTLHEKIDSLTKSHSAHSKMDNSSLLQKCNFLEEYRNSFPYQVDEGYCIYAILKTKVDVARYSRWTIVGEINNELFAIDIIRSDNQTYKEMQQLVFSTKSPQEIQAFSMHSDVWWE